jgi:hypothetical protein
VESRPARSNGRAGRDFLLHRIWAQRSNRRQNFLLQQWRLGLSEIRRLFLQKIFHAPQLLCVARALRLYGDGQALGINGDRPKKISKEIFYGRTN